MLNMKDLLVLEVSKDDLRDQFWMQTQGAIHRVEFSVTEGNGSSLNTNGKEFENNIYVCMTKSLCYTLETNTLL